MEIPVKAKDTSNTIQYMASSTVMSMIEAQKERKFYQFYTLFRASAKLLMPHMNLQARKQLQDDFNKLEELELTIKRDEKLNPNAKESQLLEIKATFAEYRDFYVYDALPKIGLGQDLEEGKIDFNQTDIDAIARVVRDIGTGLDASLKETKVKG